MLAVAKTHPITTGIGTRRAIDYAVRPGLYSPASVAFVVSQEKAVRFTEPPGQTLIADPRFIIYADGEYCLAANRDHFSKPWLCILPGSTGWFASGAKKGLPLLRGAVNPYLAGKVFDASASVSVEAPRPGDGNTIRYRAILGSSTYLPLIPEGSDQDVIELLQPDARHHPEQDVDILLTPAGLPVQISVTLPDLVRTWTQRFSGWGEPGSVVLPPADSIIDATNIQTEIH